MSTDITRDSFDPAKSFSRVIRQQGRMDLDADFNEQSDILLHLNRSFIRDLLGSYCLIDGAFAIERTVGNPNDLTITPGVCYIDGIRVEADRSIEPLQYSNQPSPDTGHDGGWADVDYVAFLDVCERHVTAVDDPSLLEPALQGADTSARTQVVWQVKVREIPRNAASLAASTYDQNGEAGQVWQEIIRNELAPGAVVWNLPPARMAASALDESDDSTAASNRPTQPNYIRDSNQHYRVEIHTGGDQSTATFKWSRDNACVTFRAMTTGQKRQLKLELAHADGRRIFKVGDTVEISGKCIIPGDRDRQLYNVTRISPDRSTITLDNDIPKALGNSVTLCKWDSRATPIAASTWMPIEQGIQIRFEPGCCYRSGEYWLIPARSDTSDIIWPQSAGKPASLPPTGGHHYYAPLAVISRRAASFETIRLTRRFLSRKNLVTME